MDLQVSGSDRNTHSLVVGYVLWIFGFMGAHRFYYGKPVTGTIWFFTLGLLFVGWIIDLFLIPAMDREADERYHAGKYNYTLAWVLMTFLGVFGVHRFYMGKWVTGLFYLLVSLSVLAGNLFGFLVLLGWLYDYLTLNSQVDELNRAT